MGKSYLLRPPGTGRRFEIVLPARARGVRVRQGRRV